MNILYISSKTGWGGIMSWMVQSAEGLSSRGHSVWILSNPKSKLVKKNYPNLKIIEKALGPDYNPLIIFWLFRFIKKYKIDLVVTNIRKEIISGGIAAKLSKIVNVRRIGLPVDINERVKPLHEKYIAHSIVPSDYVLEEASRKNTWINKNDFTTIYNGRQSLNFDEDKIKEVRNSWKVKGSELVIGITAKLSPMKNIRGLVESFSKISLLYQHVKLVITGFGPEKENLERQVNELEISNKVIFTDFTNNPQLTASCYDIAILNSIEEGFPNSLVEYMSVGTASIATNVGGVSEILVDGENGYLISPNSPMMLSDKIEMLIKDSELRYRISEAGRKTVVENFSKDKMVDEIEKLFESLIKNV